MDVFRIAFIGHRELRAISYIEKELEEIVSKKLFEKEYVEFYVGRNGTFDIVVASVIKRMQSAYGNHNSSLILVLPYSTKNHVYYEKFYDEIEYPLPRNTHYKAAIGKRNEWLVDNADLLISFVKNNAGGAYETLRYAEKKGVAIINLAPLLQ